MADDPWLCLFGASVRSAAFSALRADLHPWCVDLFADADLQGRCPCQRLPPENYPQGFLSVAGQAPPGPWMYTGALENRRSLVQALSRQRPLWGNEAALLKTIRSPGAVARMLAAAGLPCAEVKYRKAALDLDKRWLLKPRAGAGGAGIRFWKGEEGVSSRLSPSYFQEYIEGPACAAIFLADGSKARLLGVTRQLTGETWLHARPFHYCGSLGPLPLSDPLRQALINLGNALVQRCPLRGLFGVDCILQDQTPWLVEVNPRYTASMELLEYGQGIPLLALHRSVFDPTTSSLILPCHVGTGKVLGKAILFARKDLTFPDKGPWQEVLRRPANVWEMPAFADIPPVGEFIPAGRPILSFFARSTTEAGCLETLRQLAPDLDHWLHQS